MYKVWRRDSLIPLQSFQINKGSNIGKGTGGKTNAAYKKHRYNEEFRRQHKEELEKHEAAKAAFDALDGKEIPKVAELSKEYAMFLEDKKKCYCSFMKFADSFSPADGLYCIINKCQVWEG